MRLGDNRGVSGSRIDIGSGTRTGSLAYLVDQPTPSSVHGNPLQYALMRLILLTVIFHVRYSLARRNFEHVKCSS
jgi:hypothetical protein